MEIKQYFRSDTTCQAYKTVYQKRTTCNYDEAGRMAEPEQLHITSKRLYHKLEIYSTGRSLEDSDWQYQVEVRLQGTNGGSCRKSRRIHTENMFHSYVFQHI